LWLNYFLTIINLNVKRHELLANNFYIAIEESKEKSISTSYHRPLFNLFGKRVAMDIKGNMLRDERVPCSHNNDLHAMLVFAYSISPVLRTIATFSAKLSSTLCCFLRLLDSSTLVFVPVAFSPCFLLCILLILGRSFHRRTTLFAPSWRARLESLFPRPSSLLPTRQQHTVALGRDKTGRVPSVLSQT